MKKIIAIASLCGLAGTVSAQSAFEGLYGQVGIGYESVPSKLSGAIASGVSIGNSSGVTGNVSAGYYFGLTNSFLLGIGADYSPLASQKGNITFTPGGVQGNSKKTNSYNIFVSPALAIDKDKLAYAKFGYTGATIVHEFTGQAAKDTFNFAGYSLGLGYKQMFTNGLYGFAEGNYSMYTKRNLLGNNGAIVGALQPSAMNFLVGVGYKF